MVEWNTASITGSRTLRIVVDPTRRQTDRDGPNITATTEVSIPVQPDEA